MQTGTVIAPRYAPPAVMAGNSGAAAQISPIQRDVERLDRAVRDLHETIGSLDVRLQSVLQPAMPSPAATNGQPSAPPSSSLQGQIASLAQSVEEAINRVAEIRNRLDV